jgi:hypothetical protein
MRRMLKNPGWKRTRRYVGWRTRRWVNQKFGRRNPPGRVQNFHFRTRVFIRQFTR